MVAEEDGQSMGLSTKVRKGEFARGLAVLGEPVHGVAFFFLFFFFFACSAADASACVRWILGPVVYDIGGEVEGCGTLELGVVVVSHGFEPAVLDRDAVFLCDLIGSLGCEAGLVVVASTSRVLYACCLYVYP